jgi:hypothetical protein
MWTSPLKQEGHDGPEITHLYIGPWAKANLKPGAFILTNLVDTHSKMFHDKYLSYSSLGFLKEDFLRAYI